MGETKTTIKYSELEKRITKEKSNEFLKLVWKSEEEEKTIQFTVMNYEKFRCFYEELSEMNITTNYIINECLYKVIGKEKYREISEKYEKKRICLPPRYRVRFRQEYEEIYQDFLNGMTTEDIGNKYGVTKEYARKLKQRSKVKCDKSRRGNE